MQFQGRSCCAYLSAGLLLTSAAQADLKALFTFDDPNVSDQSTNETPITLNGPTWFANGYEQGALQFDGIDDYARVQLDINPWLHAMPRVTFGAWIRLDESTNWTYEVISTDDAVCDRALVADRRADGVMRWAPYPGYCPIDAGSPVSIGQWTFVAVAYDRYGESMRLYVDDNPVIELDAYNGGNLPFFDIGRNPSFGGYFKGAIDNVFVFQGLLSDSSIQSIYLGGAAAIQAATTYDDEAERIAHDGYMRDPVPDDILLHTALTADREGQARPLWRFTISSPDPNSWMLPDFDESSWATGVGGFTHPDHIWERDLVGTAWTTTDLWMRTTFEASATDLEVGNGSPVGLWGRCLYEMDVYINGTLAATGLGNSDASGIRETAGYRYWPLRLDAQAGIQPGTNTIAIHANVPNAIGYVDIGIVRNPFNHLEASGWSINPELEAFRDAAVEISAAAQMPATTIAVVRDGRLVLNYGIGYKDKEQTQVIEPDAYFRLASLSKPPAAAALRKLIRDGVTDPVSGTLLTLNAAVWPFFEARGVTPFPAGSVDAAAGQITLNHLIYHRSGVPGIGWFGDIAKQAGKRRENLDLWDAIRQLYGLPLLNPPGTACRYSNEGYFLMRALIDAITGDMIAYLNNEVCSHNGSGRPPFRIAYEYLQQRDVSEPWYRTSEGPYERGFFLEDALSLTATAPGYALFASQYAMPHGGLDLSLCCQDTSTCHECCQKGGLMTGTSTYVRQIEFGGHQTVFVVLTNQDNDMILGRDSDWFPGYYYRFVRLITSLNNDAWFCTSDLDQSGLVEFNDAILLFGLIGSTDLAGDVNGDSTVNIVDYALVQANFGSDCR
jgi:CubicO group peptidase (beta-lactamase class C family)